MQFSIHAIDARQEIVALELDAASEAAARDVAQQRGLIVFSLECKKALFSLRLRRAGGFKTTLFSIELMSLLEAGLNLVEALQTLAEKEVAGERRGGPGALGEAIHRGEPVSPAGAGMSPQLP